MNNFKLYLSPIFKVHWLLIMLMLLIVNCDKIAAPSTIPAEKFARIYTDYIVVADTANTALHTTILDTMLSRYSEDRDKFDATLRYYREDPLRWEKFLQLVVQNLEEKRKEKNGSSE
ncbi:DUF4296 domain-containing protein [candidate division KSB1 bacterium]|nr:DUF4296 domain-containing protein [candidate division KSB1 bacterium]